jgi:hypothetical protein
LEQRRFFFRLPLFLSKWRPSIRRSDPQQEGFLAERTKVTTAMDSKPVQTTMTAFRTKICPAVIISPLLREWRFSDFGVLPVMHSAVGRLDGFIRTDPEWNSVIFFTLRLLLNRKALPERRKS